jgi:hypothetical protein
VLATISYGDTLLGILELAFLFLWIWIAIGVIFDIFRSHDLSNGAKTLWVLFIIVLPFVGVLAYVLVRGHTMHEHQLQDAQARHAFFSQYTRSGPADDLAKLADLRDRGVLNPDEFERAKAKVLS